MTAIGRFLPLRVTNEEPSYSAWFFSFAAFLNFSIAARFAARL